MKDDFTLNQILRKSFRVWWFQLQLPGFDDIMLLQEKKAQIKAEMEKDEELKSRASLSIPLVPEKREDVSTARRTVFSGSSSSEDSKRKRLEIKMQPIFSSTMDTPERKRAKIALLKACKGAKGTRTEKTTSAKDTKSVLGIRKKSE